MLSTILNDLLTILHVKVNLLCPGMHMYLPLILSYGSPGVFGCFFKHQRRFLKSKKQSRLTLTKLRVYFEVNACLIYLLDQVYAIWWKEAYSVN